jgi:type I restriction enzyme, S subunit
MSKTKPLRSAPESETCLPEGWANPLVGEVLDVRYGKGLPERNRTRGPYPVYGSNGVVGHHDKPLTTGPTIIVGRKGTVGAVHISREPCWPIDTTYFVDEMPDLDMAYLYYALSTLGLSEMDTSSAIPGLNREDVLKEILPLAPQAEQKRIVTKVEELLGRVNGARARLAKMPVILKRFRESVLAAASSGALTANWREAHPEVNDALRVVEALTQAHEAAGGHKRGNAAAPTEEAHDLDPDTLPASWKLTDLRTAVWPDRPITYGILKPGPHTPNGIPYVRVADFPNDRLELTAIRRTTKDIERQYVRARLRPGDVLLSIRGTVGRVCIVPPELENANITQDTARLSIQNVLDRDYVAWFLRAKQTQDRMRRAMKGVAVHGINIGDVRAIQLPVPPSGEQREIVRRVEALFALAHGIDTHVRAATIRAERLQQAILVRAFRGELVPPEAELAAKEGRDYESASVLLERIQAIRNQQKPAKRARGGKQMAKRSGRQAAEIRRPLAEVLREQGKPLSPERLFALAGFDEDTVDDFYEQLRGLIKDGTIRERRRDEKDVTLEALGA